VHARAFGQRLREIGRIRLAVTGNPHRSREVVGPQDRNSPACFGGGDEFELDAEAPGSRHLPLHRHEALGRSRDVQAAALLPAGGEPGLFLERCVEVDPVAAHSRCVARRARLAHQPRGVPRRAAGELALLEQHHVLRAELRKVVCRGNARDAASDHDDASLSGQPGSHNLSAATPATLHITSAIGITVVIEDVSIQR